MTHKNTQHTTEATEIESSSFSMLEKIHEHLSDQIQEWTTIYNEDRHTDAGNPLRPHAQGRISAFVELRTYLLKLEKEHGKLLEQLQGNDNDEKL